MASDRSQSQPGAPTRLAGPLLLVLAAAIAAAPIWIHGPVGADDFEFHLISWLDAQHSWLHGIPYPHWAADPNFGAGEPRFVFYPPLTWMMGAALGLLLPWAAMPFAMTFLLLAASGLATRALARTVLAEAPATLAGCAALFSGYALFTAYDRTAFGEMAGGLWIPLLLLFALSPLKQKSAWERQNLGGGNPIPSLWRRALDGSVLPLALVIAGCWLSDAPVGVMGSYLLAGVALAASIARRSWLPAVRAFVAAVLGVALTGAYLIPAAWEQRWVDIQQATGVKGDPGLRIENNWIFPHHANPALHARDLTLHWISWVNAAMIALALGSVLAFWLRVRLTANKAAESGDSETGAGPLQRSFWLPLAAIPAVVLLLQLPLSLPIWNLLPKLRFLQFPWRWLLVVEAPMGLFFAAAVWPRNSRSGRLRVTVAVLCALLFAGSTVFAAKNFFRDPKEDDDLATILENYRTGAGFVGTDEYAPPGAENTLVAQGLPDACLTDDFDDEQGVQATPDASPIWRPEQKSCISTTGASPTSRPEHMRVSTNALRAGFLVLKLRRYPAWRITVNGRAVSGLQPRDDGLISVPVPQGPVSVTVDWATTPDVIIGRWVSALTLAMLIVLGLVERRNRRQA